MRLALIALLPLLTGCVLQSDTPLITDANAFSVFGSKPIDLQGFQWQDGGWLATVPPIITVVPEGNHYIVPNLDESSDPAKITRYYFLPLGEGQLLIEVVTKDVIEYGAASWDGTEMLAAAFDCGALQGKKGVDALVTFDGDNCSLKPDATDPARVFTTLLADLPSPALRLKR